MPQNLKELTIINWVMKYLKELENKVRKILDELGIKKVVLMYSGGLDTTTCALLLKEAGAEVFAVTIDTGGFEKEELKKIEEKAQNLGVKFMLIDGKKSIWKEGISYAIKFNASWGWGSPYPYPLSTPVERYVICKLVSQFAQKVKADVIIHGSSGLGNEQVRFDVTLKALSNIPVIALIRELNLHRDLEIKYLESKGIKIGLHKRYSMNFGAWGATYAGGELENLGKELPEDAWQWTTPVEKTPDKPEYLVIEWKNGIPVALNGKKYESLELVKELNKIGGKHGIGRIYTLEDRVVGLKTHEAYEVPSAVILIQAHKGLEALVMTSHQLKFKWFEVDPLWSELMYNGLWIDPLRENLEKFVDDTQKVVTGLTKIKLFKGVAMVIGLKSPFSLHNKQLISYTSRVSKIDQTKMSYFIDAFGLQSIMAQKLRCKNENLE